MTCSCCMACLAFSCTSAGCVGSVANLLNGGSACRNASFPMRINACIAASRIFGSELSRDSVINAISWASVVPGLPNAFSTPILTFESIGLERNSRIVATNSEFCGAVRRSSKIAPPWAFGSRSLCDIKASRKCAASSGGGLSLPKMMPSPPSMCGKRELKRSWPMASIRLSRSFAPSCRPAMPNSAAHSGRADYSEWLLNAVRAFSTPGPPWITTYRPLDDADSVLDKYPELPRRQALRLQSQSTPAVQGRQSRRARA